MASFDLSAGMAWHLIEIDIEVACSVHGIEYIFKTLRIEINPLYLIKAE